MNRAEFLALGGLLLVKPGRAIAAVEQLALPAPKAPPIRGNWEGGSYPDDYGVTRHLYRLRTYVGESEEPNVVQVSWEGEIAAWPPGGELEHLLVAEEERALSTGAAIEAGWFP